MSFEADRQHRQDPARDRPIRDFATYARNYGLGRGAGEDPISQGVKLGYSVLDEQMREGQRLAERLRGAARPGVAAAGDMGTLIERALNIYRDIGALAFAATEALARNPMGAGPRAEASAPVAAAPFSLDVKSARRVNVKLDLKPGVLAARVGPLQAALGGAPAIESVGFEAAAGAAPTLRLEIADEQPAGVYNAVVVEPDSGEPLGTLTVRILG